MENIILQFNNKNQLLEFCSQVDGICCNIDLEKLTLSSALTEPIIELAISKFGVSIFSDSLIY